MLDKRFRVKRYSIFNTPRKRSFLSAFKKRYPEHKDITRTEFREIIIAFNEMCVMDQITKNSDGVLLPQQLGHLYIALFNVPLENKIKNFTESRKQGRDVYYHNFETDGKIGKLMFKNKSGSKLVHDLKVWEFKAGKQLKHALKEAILKNYKKYETNDNNRRSYIKS